MVSPHSVLYLPDRWRLLCDLSSLSCKESGFTKNRKDVMLQVKFSHLACLLIAFCFAGPLIASAQTELPDAIRPSPAVLSQNQAQNADQNPDRNQDQSQKSSYEPITSSGRFKWFIGNTIGPQSLVAGVISAGFGTAINKPKEYGPHWEGFGKRYAVRLTGIGTQNAMEAGLGSLWGEDPRYFRAPHDKFGQRVVHIIKMTFIARRPDGDYALAYARFVAIPATNFLSNTWRADSEATTGNAIERTFLGFVGRMAGNAFKEFWPDVNHHIIHKKH